MPPIRCLKWRRRRRGHRQSMATTCQRTGRNGQTRKRPGVFHWQCTALLCSALLCSALLTRIDSANRIKDVSNSTMSLRCWELISFGQPPGNSTHPKPSNPNPKPLEASSSITSSKPRQHHIIPSCTRPNWIDCYPHQLWIKLMNFNSIEWIKIRLN